MEKLGMEVFNVENEEVEKFDDHDSDNDDNDEALDQQEAGSIDSIVKEVCIEDSANIKEDIEALSGLISEDLKQKLSSIQSAIPKVSTTPSPPNKYGTETYSPLLELSNGICIRKTTAIWLFQEGERVSSDRLFRVRAKQPFSNETRATCYEESSRTKPHIAETVEIGDMCVFYKGNGVEIGRVLQFSHHEKKTISTNQYKGRVASIKNKELGVLCTWFQETNGMYRMCKSEHHSYLPLSTYMCTLTQQCFIPCVASKSSNSIMTVQQNVTATLEEFTLTEDCKQFIIAHTMSCAKELTSPPVQPSPPAVTKAGTSTQTIWLTINHTHLYQSDKDALLGNEWLNDQHMRIAQALIKQQHPHINGLLPTVIQGKNPLPQGSLQILHINTNHWVTVSTLNTESEDIIMYDSKYSSLSETTEDVLAQLVNTDKPFFSVKVASVTKQSCLADCGLFAIAYMTQIANKLNPSLCVFHQAEMRKHLILCFEQKQLNPFPILKERRSSNIPKMLTVKVYCYCRQTYNGKMVECSGVCGEWYHIKCISTRIQKNKEWFCKNCITI